jgi:hypothetical protein
VVGCVSSGATNFVQFAPRDVSAGVIAGHGTDGLEFPG